MREQINGLQFSAEAISTMSDTDAASIRRAHRPSGMLVQGTLHPGLEEAQGEGRETILGQPYIPRWQRKVGQLLRETCIRNNVYAGEIANVIVIDRRHPRGEYIEAFQEGRLPNPDVPKILNATEKFISIEDAGMQEMREIQQTHEEEQKWLWRLGHDNLSVADAVRFMRLSAAETEYTFARRCGIGERTLAGAEVGEVPPSLYTLNQVLKGTGFDEKYEKVAQRIRLKHYDIQPMSIEEITERSFGEILEYLMIQNGLSRTEVGVKAGNKSRSWMMRVIQNNISVITDTQLDGFSEVLNLNDETSNFLRQKARGEDSSLTPSLRAELLDGFYFSELDVQDAPFSQEDTLLALEVHANRTFKGAFRKLRKKKQFERNDFAVTANHVALVEKGVYIPDERTIAEMAKQLGFSIVDETTQALLNQAKRQRKPHGIPRKNVNKHTEVQV